MGSTSVSIVFVSDAEVEHHIVCTVPASLSSPAPSPVKSPSKSSPTKSPTKSSRLHGLSVRNGLLAATTLEPIVSSSISVENREQSLEVDMILMTNKDKDREDAEETRGKQKRRRKTVLTEEEQLKEQEEVEKAAAAGSLQGVLVVVRETPTPTQPQTKQRNTIDPGSRKIFEAAARRGGGGVGGDEEEGEGEESDSDDSDDEDEGEGEGELGTVRYFDGQRRGGKGAPRRVKAKARDTEEEEAPLQPSLPQVASEDLQRALKHVPSTHKSQSERLAAWHQGQFFQWYFELQRGFNLLFYGYGSKKVLLMKFAKEVLGDCPQVVVNGYFPGITPKSVLTSICEGVLGHRGAFRDLVEQCAFIHAYFSNAGRLVKRLYVVVHNIDGAALRTEKAQQVFSLLAAVPCLHLLASIDHINAGLLWDSSKIAKLNWIYHDVTTYQRYTTETSFESNFIHTQTSGQTRGATYVLKSLTSNARGIFKILAQYQVRQGPDSLGITAQALYTKCREAFLVSNDLALRTQLTEFKDHELIATRKGPDGTEYLYSQLDRAALQTLLDKDLS